MHFFTSVTANYIPKARILAKTLKQYNPTAYFILALSDNLPEHFNLEDEPFDDILLTDQLPIIESPKSFFFRHNITEVCTAVKPGCALYIMEKFGAEKVCYLDPDIAVFSELIEVEEALNTYSMIFTPHTTIPEERENYIVGNEILFLKRGTYNLGFFAVKNDEEGKKFLSWWNKRLMKFCLDDDYTLLELLDEQGLLGLFTDQKWIDLVPSLFDNYHILKHPGYNVSTWNLSNRIVTKDKNGLYLVNGEPLRFFHFSGVDSGAHSIVLSQLNDFYPHTKTVNEISKWYLEQEKLAGEDEWKKVEWKYTRYENGLIIPKVHRKIMLIRRDTHPYFSNPLEVHEGFCFYNWMMNEYGEYIASKKVEASHIYQKKDSLVIKCLKKFIRKFVPEKSRLYNKLKRIWKAIKS
jgi:hypothetical protein